MSEDFIFVSGNLKKVHYLERFLDRKVEHHNLDLVEIQSLDPAEVLENKARHAFKALKKSVLVEDTSLKFHALGGLPGPFIKFFLSEIGNEGICKILKFFKNRNASATVIYGLYDGKNFQAFSAEVTGIIADKPKNGRGMGWDPIFIPTGQTKTYAQMDEDEYAKYSVRRMAVEKLAYFLKSSNKRGEL